MTELILDSPRARGLFVLTAHPEGCRILSERMLARADAAFEKPLASAQGKTALVLGSTSFGYGSSTAIALRKAGFDAIVGVGFETAPAFRGEKLAMSSPGWYLTHALHHADDAYRTYLADAFAPATRDRVIEDLKREGRSIDLVVYSVAAPRRTHLGEEWNSSLLVVGDPLEVVGLNFKSGQLEDLTVPAADPLAVEHTRRVMGGDDLEMWVSALLHSGLAAEGMTVTALSYIGPDLEPLRRMYWDGALGDAKKHIDATTAALNTRLADRVGGKAMTAMNPAVVTAASVAIPAMLRYMSDYLGCDDAGKGEYADPLQVGIDFTQALYGEGEPWREMLDDAGRLRLDGRELRAELQDTIAALWREGKPGEPPALTRTGLERFKREHAMLYGWQVEGVDYGSPYLVDPELAEPQRVVNLIE